MIPILIVAGSLLGIAALLAIIRLIKGPRPIDRVVATDVLIAIVIGALAIEAAIKRHAYTLPVVLVLALLAFAGTVSMARFVANRTDLIGGDDEEVQ